MAVDRLKTTFMLNAMRISRETAVPSKPMFDLFAFTLYIEGRSKSSTLQRAVSYFCETQGRLHSATKIGGVPQGRGGSQIELSSAGRTRVAKILYAISIMSNYINWWPWRKVD